jgi:Ca2+-binding RTX toxin-like protein
VFNFADGNRLVLIDGSAGLTVADMNSISVNITDEPVTLGYQIADEGSDFVFEALNDGTGAALVNFGATSAIAATATIADGVGSGVGGRFDEVRFVNATGLEGTKVGDNLTALGTQAVTLLGLDGTDMLTGAGGSDTLDGGAGGDYMAGGLESDTYVVENMADVVDESGGDGVDLIKSAITFSLADGLHAMGDIENLTLIGLTAINATGNALGNVISGNSAANVIDGGTGADIMDGQGGNDIYVVDDLLDQVSETSSTGGTDLVKSSVTFALDVNLENLTLTGSGSIDGTGNAANNNLTGNSGNNRLDGGLGADTMTGGLGDDTYVVNVAGDNVVEATGVGSGTDTIETALTTFSLSGSANVENLIFTGIGNFTGTGNALANTITGGDGADKLSGGTGADTLIGGKGNDTLTGGTQNDQFYFGDLTVFGDFGKDKITDFAGGAGLGDVVQIDDSWGFATAAAVVAALTVAGADKVLTIDGDTSITFVGKAGLIFNDDDFLII